MGNNVSPITLFLCSHPPNLSLQSRCQTPYHDLQDLCDPNPYLPDIISRQREQQVQKPQECAWHVLETAGSLQCPILIDAS